MHYHLGVVLMQIEQRDAANDATPAKQSMSSATRSN